MASGRTSRTPKTRTKAPPKKQHDWKPAWLEAFRELGTVTAACKRVEVGRRTVYDARADKEFASQWDAIEQETTEAMEREAYRRGVEGVVEPVVSAGKYVTDVRKYSDTLLIFMLKARKPDVYRDNVKVEHSGRVEQVTVEIPDTAERRDEVLGLLAQAATTLLAQAGAVNGNGG